jgi:hypothetical protein
LRTAAIGIADACVMDADARLALLLAQAIEECLAILTPVPVVVRAADVVPASMEMPASTPERVPALQQPS